MCAAGGGGGGGGGGEICTLILFRDCINKCNNCSCNIKFSPLYTMKLYKVCQGVYSFFHAVCLFVSLLVSSIVIPSICKSCLKGLHLTFLSAHASAPIYQILFIIGS